MTNSYMKNKYIATVATALTMQNWNLAKKKKKKRVWTTVPGVKLSDSKLMIFLYSFCKRSLVTIFHMQNVKDNSPSLSSSLSVPSWSSLNFYDYNYFWIFFWFSSELHIDKTSIIPWKEFQVWEETNFILNYPSIIK